MHPLASADSRRRRPTLAHAWLVLATAGTGLTGLSWVVIGPTARDRVSGAFCLACLAAAAWHFRRHPGLRGALAIGGVWAGTSLALLAMAPAPQASAAISPSLLAVYNLGAGSALPVLVLCRLGVAQATALVVSVTLALLLVDGLKSAGWLRTAEQQRLRFAPVAAVRPAGAGGGAQPGRPPTAQPTDGGATEAPDPAALADVENAAETQLRPWMTAEGSIPHPVIGWVNRPHGVMRSYYPDDPRGYFETRYFVEVEPTDDPANFWQLESEAPGAAHRAADPPPPARVRVEIDQPSAEDWQIRLIQPEIPLSAGGRYEVQLRARADAPRQVHLRMTRRLAPFDLGLNRRLLLQPNWADYRFAFVASRDEPRAILQFDFGTSDTAWELGDVRLLEIVPQADGSQGSHVVLPRLGTWRLEQSDGASGRLEQAGAPPGAMRVEIDRPAAEPWHLAVSRGYLPIEGGESYLLSGQIRADAPRGAVVSISAYAEPWSLGLSKELELTRQWTPLQMEFIPQRTGTSLGRFRFDVGGSPAAVELDRPRLEVGRLVPPPNRPAESLPVAYTVTYRTNAYGMRGPETTLTRPDQTLRIACLGDSFTLGVGVHEADIFPTLLGPLLAQGQSPPTPWREVEVLNCGVSGFSTREERLFFEQIAEPFDPQIVLVVMVSNDDLSYLEEVERGYLDDESPAEAAPAAWMMLRRLQHRRPPPDFSRCVTELKQLEARCLAQNRKLGVVVFRMFPHDSQWLALLETVQKGLAGSSIPVLDLGPSLYEGRDLAELLVHRIDGHPSALAHRLASEQIAAWLQGLGWLRASPAAARNAPMPSAARGGTGE